MSEMIEVQHLFDLHLDAPPGGRRYDTGTETGIRRWIGIVNSGRFDGERLSGRVLPGGGDWPIVRSDRQMTVDGRMALETDDGAVIMMRFGGRFVVPAHVNATDPARLGALDSSQYYLRTTPEFETGSARYAWLNDVVAVGFGTRRTEGMRYRISHIL